MIDLAQRHMRAYIKSLKRQAAERNGDSEIHRRELASIERKIANATAAILDGGLNDSDSLAAALRDLEAQKEQVLAKLSDAAPPELDALPDMVPDAIERYRAEVGPLEQLSDTAKPGQIARAREALRSLLGEIWLQPNGDHLVAHVELQNQALALVSANVANGGSGGVICTVPTARSRVRLK